MKTILTRSKQVTCNQLSVSFRK